MTKLKVLGKCLGSAVSQALSPLDLEQELNVEKEAEQVRESSPALSRGIPVTTPHRSPSPKRVNAPEKVFAEEDDNLLAHR